MSKVTGYDFAGWATRNDMKCSDGRTIRRDAFKDDDGKKVPLVWNHRHDDPTNVLGHALLFNQPEGVYAYGFFNDTEKAQNAKAAVMHGDVNAMSIFANKLQQTSGKDVLHGVIREVSLVLAGANPGAFIDSVMVHGELLDEEAVIFTGEELSFEHADKSIEGEDTPVKKPEEKKEKTIADILETFTEKEKTVLYGIIGNIVGGKTAEAVAHADDEEDEDADDGETVGDVINGLSKEKRTVFEYLVGKALEEADSDGEDDEDTEDIQEDKKPMKHNAFDAATAPHDDTVLSHADEESILDGIKLYGSLRESLIRHNATDISVDALQHEATYGVTYGVTPIDVLYPDAQLLRTTPDFIQRDQAWVSKVLNGVHNSAFSRIKSLYANITEDEARAKGYIKGKRKKEEVFKLLKRTTTPTTIYKKQKLDRDDLADITGLDVVAMIRSEMKLMWNEELARAILIGDGREASDDDKINELAIRPIAHDHDLFNIKVGVAGSHDDENALAREFIKAVIRARKNYKGAGNPTCFTTEDMLTSCLLLTDVNGRDMYDSPEKLAQKLRVKEIVTVPVMEGATDADGKEILAIVVNLADYAKGADRMGALNMFDDFDIDYNQLKYLLEGRCSGALTTPFSAMTVTLGGTNSGNMTDVLKKINDADLDEPVLNV